MVDTMTGIVKAVSDGILLKPEMA